MGAALCALEGSADCILTAPLAATQDGTGDLERLRSHENEFLGRLLSNRRMPSIEVAWDSRRLSADGLATVRTGHFLSPVAHLLPPEAANARVQLVVPANGGAVRGVVLHFAATADQTFVLRRRLLAQPLLQHGIASVLLMPAYYGSRRPAAQTLHFSRTLADFCLLTHSMICEGASLLDWITDTLLAPGKEFAGARLGVTGVSMGGAMAAVVAAMTLHPIAVSPCLGTWTGAGVYTSGALAPQVAWRALAKEPGVSAGLGGPRGHVRRVLEHNDIDVIVAALNAAPSRPPHGPRALVMCNAVHDKYVDPSEAQHLFQVLAPTCAPGDAVQRWIGGGHVTAVLASTPDFVTACVESFDVLDARLAALEAQELGTRGRAAAAVHSGSGRDVSSVGGEHAHEGGTVMPVAASAPGTAPRPRARL